MDREVGIVGLEHGDGVLHRVVGQADPAGGLDDGEGIELAGIADDPGQAGEEIIRRVIGLWENQPDIRERMLAVLRTALSHDYAARLLRDMLSSWLLRALGDVLADDRRNVYAFARVLGDEVVLVVLNASAVRRHLRLPVKDLGWRDGLILHNLLGFEEYIVSGDWLVVSVPPWGGIWIG